jgi:hypothetical protein
MMSDDWTTPSQAEGERDDDPAQDRSARSTPSQAEGDREEETETQEQASAVGKDSPGGPGAGRRRA